MSFRAYPSYRPSNVEWLGDLPDHWEVMRFSRLVDIAEGQVDPRQEPYASMALIAPNHIEAGTGRLLGLETATNQGADSGKYLFAAGDVLYSKIRPSLAKVVLAPCDGLCSADMYPLKARAKLSEPFLKWFLLSAGFTAWATVESDRVAMPKINREKLNELPIAAPLRSEQTAIATFLDRETGKIDALVEEQQRLVELLKEKRQAVISHAVTKGLDPTVPMKNTGIEWLGDVPAHWDVVPTGYRYEVQLGRMLNAERSEGPDMRPYLRVFDVQWGAINTDDLPLMDFPFDARERYRLQPGDLIVNEGGSYVGRSAIWRGDLSECYYQKALHRLRARNSANDTAEFFLFIMEFATKLGVFVAGGNQTTIDHLTAEQLREYRFAFPPLPEQVAISSFIVAETVKLEALMDEAETAIALFHERRAALISAAVTGKIDVRGLAPSVKEDAYAA